MTWHLLNEVFGFRVHRVSRLERRAFRLHGNPVLNEGQGGFQVLKSLPNLVRLWKNMVIVRPKTGFYLAAHPHSSL